MNGLYGNKWRCSHGDQRQWQQPLVIDEIVAEWVVDPFLAATAMEKLLFVWVFDNFHTFLKCCPLADLGGARPARAPHLPGILVFDDILGHIV